MNMKDIYLYDDVPVLKNLLNIKDEELLEKAESDITYIRLLDIDDKINGTKFDYDHLKAIHKYIFGDIYEWAGTERTISMVKGERVLGGDTVRYSIPGCIEKDAISAIKNINAVEWNNLDIAETADKFSVLIAALWQVHPFREGNTRTVITFATQYAEAHGFKMNKSLLKDNANYVRDSLVKASDGPYSEYKYLVKIIKDAIERG
jgi:cell filamentation protein